MKDAEILSEIRKGNREKPLKFLYQEFPKIKTNIIASGGNEEIAQEIFNDSLILLLEKLNDPKFELSSKLSTYLYGINRLLWKNELRRQNKRPELEWRDTLILYNEDIGYDFEREEQLKKIEAILKTISTKCQQIFELFYFKKQSMQIIAETLNYSSVNSAKTQKYKCLEKAIQMATVAPQSSQS
ncbi:MAG: sigma-70 family RNA polymerase sigma factor [Flavobacteriales bacterium]|nr:sigma-70 family RNA polymerase sigma factor [Flavobacteriales bacterium]